MLAKRHVQIGAQGNAITDVTGKKSFVTSLQTCQYRYASYDAKSSWSVRLKGVSSYILVILYKT